MSSPIARSLLVTLAHGGVTYGNIAQPPLMANDVLSATAGLISTVRRDLLNALANPQHLRTSAGQNSGCLNDALMVENVEQCSAPSAL